MQQTSLLHSAQSLTGDRWRSPWRHGWRRPPTRPQPWSDQSAASVGWRWPRWWPLGWVVAVANNDLIGNLTGAHLMMGPGGRGVVNCWGRRRRRRKRSRGRSSTFSFHSTIRICILAVNLCFWFKLIWRYCVLSLGWSLFFCFLL